MSWRPHGRAFVSRGNLDAFAVCDRCGFYYNRSRLQWQFDWEGPRLQNLRLLVCDICLDKPFEHNRPLTVPPDPVPVMNPRPDTYALTINALFNLYDTNLEPMTDSNGVIMTSTDYPVPPLQPQAGYAGFYALQGPNGAISLDQTPLQFSPDNPRNTGGAGGGLIFDIDGDVVTTVLPRVGYPG